MNNRITNFALLLVSPIPVMSGTVLMAATPSIAMHFQNVTDAKLLSQLILAIPFIAITIFSPFVYPLTKFFGKKKTFVYALIYISVVGTLSGLLDNIYLILIARLFFGFGIAVISSIFLSMIGEYFEGHKRNLFLGYQSSFTFLMGALFTMLGAWVGEYSWRYCFYLYTLIILIVFTSAFFLKFPEQQKRQEKRKLIQFGLFKQYFSVFFFAFLLKLLFYVFPTQIPFLLTEKGLSNYMGVILSSLLICAVISSLMFGYMNKIMSLKTLLVSTLLLKAISYFGISISSNIWFILVFASLSGVSSGLLHINLIKWLLDQIPSEYRLQGTSILTSSMHCGFFVSPIILYPVVNTYGIASSFLLASLLLIIASFYLQIKMTKIKY